MPDDLIYDADEVARSDVLAILVPGALARIDIFDKALDWRDKGYAVVRYRFPGLDGRPLDPPLRIADAADDIADFAARFPEKRVRLLGYSTGGPVVLTAASRIRNDLRVALMSSAVENGGGSATALRGARQIAAAAVRRRSLSLRDIWLEYYRVLLFGSAKVRDAQIRAEADGLIVSRLADMVFPEGGLPRAHTDDLRHWRVPRAFDVPATRIRFFVGQEDCVFTAPQTQAFAHRLGCTDILCYPNQGHLLFLTETQVFDDILAFFEDKPLPARSPARQVGAGNSD